jgi:uncharacterized protein YdeI (YjbR/CyaY-like superfamily)
VAEPTYFVPAAEWRAWLVEHHDAAAECVVGFVKAGTGAANMTWSESVDEALCFGWIDAVRHRIDDERYSIRFVPRKPSSTWSKVNVAKVEALRSAGRMTSAGEGAFAQRGEARSGIYAYEKGPTDLAAEDRDRFMAETAAWTFFSNQAAWYRRTAIHWVTSARRDETRARRLEQLIDDSAAGRRLRHLSRV